MSAVLHAAPGPQDAPEALFLNKFASKAHLLVQTSRFEASESLASAVEAAPYVQIHLAMRLVNSAGEKSVTGVRAASRDGAEQDLSVGGVFVYLQGSRTHVQQAVIAATDGVVAAVTAEKYLNHRSKTKVDLA